MSEYWKSTPKYWCKFCKTYVRDTPFDKQQHDATPRHQGNIQRSLRTMHREHEREDREKQWAKNEIARLNGIVTGVKLPIGTNGSSNTPSTSSSAATKPASGDERKRQLKQLADLGVAIPDEYRAEMAMAGDWQTVSIRRLDSEIKTEDDIKPDVQNIGVRKRRHEGAEEEEEAGPTVVRKGWGTTFRQYPGQASSIDDIGALMKGKSEDTKAEFGIEPVPVIKQEETQDDTSINVKTVTPDHDDTAVKQEQDDTSIAPVVFKKRKAKITKVV